MRQTQWAVAVGAGEGVALAVAVAEAVGVTVAVGVCPISGGIFRESYAVLAPIDQYIPIDVNVPGCPPRPQAIIAGVAKAIAIWRERL